MIHWLVFIPDEAQGDKQKETIRSKCTTYLNRYEQIKKFLKEGKDKKPVKVNNLLFFAIHPMLGDAVQWKLLRTGALVFC